MQVSTRLFYDRASAAMGALSAQADTLQTQIATGKKLAVASDDSVAYARLRGVAQASADAKASGTNLDLAASVLAQADSTLTAMTAQLQQASELAIQARSGTQDKVSLGALADGIDAIRDQLADLGNAVDPRGLPLFGGGDGGAAVTANADGSYSYAATSPSAIPVGGGQSVQPSDTAHRVFTSAAGDALAMLTRLSAALRAGTDVDAAAASAVGDLATATTQVSTVQASLGARAAHVELAQAALTRANTDREATRSGLEDTDVTAAITQLQKTMTVLSATQASFTKLQGLSLFDYLK
ncbi:flagellin [Sphingomonas bacterium]|uniref:flagellin N-terminal helical domain-containing protein n=1 Tax=Sphingomonas bacterium TaxID=1895847 RepID=UPI001574FF28|nr:flagellin [Sphingomonas bacterium]